ncbi:MAG: 16S rRNA (cytosine(967)-C(5))-methyltransferase RsmB [Candidatus Nitrotoga sp.]
MHNTQLAASDVVRQVLTGQNLNQVLSAMLQNMRDSTPQQRGALQDLSYGTLRFYGQLTALLKQLLHKPLSDERVRCLLLIALYQLLYSKADCFTVVDQAVRAAKKIQPHAGGLVNAVLRNFIRQQATLLQVVAQSEEGRYSYPQWWIDKIKTQYGAQAEKILLAGNQHPPMTLRVNRHHHTSAEYLALLAQHGIAARLILPDAIQLEHAVAVDKLPGFFDGLVSVQDAGAQYAAPLLDVQDGMRVLDACAAPGGKSTHLLELANIDLLALDKDAERLTRVQENLQRLHLSAKLQAGDAAQPQDWWDGKLFQRILADVPCSASGVVRRHPDIKWLRRPADIAGFAQQQRNILHNLWSLLEVGGKFLYVSCSVFAQENQQVVDEFTRQQPDAQLMPMLAIAGVSTHGQFLPDDQHDGFFYALLHKQAQRN